MADRPSSPAARGSHSRRGSGHSSLRGEGRNQGRGRGQHGTPFKPNANNATQNEEQTRRGIHSKPQQGTKVKGQGRGRHPYTDTTTKKVHIPSPLAPRPEQPELNTKPSEDEVRQIALDRDQVAARREKVHANYAERRKYAIENKLMDAPGTSKKLEDSIRRIGTCTQFCDEKERVDRMFENLVDASEMLPHPVTSKGVPIEGRMVKRFRRAAAGDPDQQLEELRTPYTLRRTMDYLIQGVIATSERLIQVHKFVWDRTRAIRNDFTIQRFYKPEDVKHEIDCYERIARFHIMSMHELVNPDIMHSDEHYDGQQDLEQLNKTMLTLLTKYDDFRHTLDFPNEPEFRAYFILLEMRNATPDLEDRVQRWPRHILNEGRVQTALKLYRMACSTDTGYGPLQPFIPTPIAQANSGQFWTLLDSLQVSYLMACVAEMSFFNIRFTALDALWRSSKNASKQNQSALRFWSKPALMHYLQFDLEEEAEEFCSDFGLFFTTGTDPKTGVQEEHLDFASNDATSLDRNSLNRTQIFSGMVVERKRHHRTLLAIIDGMSVAEAKRNDQVKTPKASQESADAKRHSMFLQDDDDDDDAFMREDGDGEARTQTLLNPAAALFLPQGSLTTQSSTQPASTQPAWMTNFGQERSADLMSPGGPPKDLFAPKPQEPNPSVLSPTAAMIPASPFQAKDSDKTSSSLAIPATTTAPASGFTGFVASPSFASRGSAFFNQTTPATTQAEQTESTPQLTAFLKPQEQTVAVTQGKPAFSFPPLAPATSASEAPQPTTSLLDTFRIPAPATSQVTSSLSDTPQPSPSTRPATSQATQPFKFNFATTSTSFPSQPTSVSQTDQTFIFSTDLSSTTDTGTSTLVPLPISSNSTETITPSIFAHSISSAKQPPSGPIQFPPVTINRSESELASTTPSAPPAKNTPIPWKAPLPVSAQSATQSRPSPCSAQPTPLAPVSEPGEPAEKGPDQEQLLHDLVRLGLVQTDGILDMFVSHKLSSIVRGVFDGFQQRRFVRRIAAVRKSVLKRKFFTLWKNIAESRRLRKRANSRRARLAASMKADAEKQRRREEELHEIYEADRISKMIQQEQRRRREELAQRRKEEEERKEATRAALAKASARDNARRTQAAGQKRKTPANSESSSNLDGVAMSPMHKRSRTISADEADAILRSPVRSSNGSLRKSLSQKSLRQSVNEQAVDRTHTDYFRLIAYGIDPKTPLTPLTNAQVEEQKKKKEERDATTIARYSRGRITKSVKSTGESASTTSAPSSPAEEAFQFEQEEEPAPKAVSIYNPDEDPVIRQLRETKATLMADAEWYKTQTAELEKEVEQQEEFRRSLTQSQSSNSSFGASTNGFARSFSGYEYVPPNLNPGQSLSRTEERIRRTGARGLATKPIGGSPRSDYAPVALSRKSALRYSQGVDQATEAARPRKRSIDELDQTNGLGGTGSAVYTAAQVPSSLQAAKRPRNEEVLDSPPAKPIYAVNHTRSNPFSIQSTTQYEEAEELEADEEEEEITEEELVEDDYNYIRNPNRSAYIDQGEDYSEDEEAEGDDEDEEDEEEEEHENEEDQPHLVNVYGANDWQESEYGETDDGSGSGYTPAFGHELQPSHPFSRNGSQALSGVPTPDAGAGASADDAIELSD